MEGLLGIDIGTSSLKSLIMTRNGTILAVAAKEYSFDVPESGRAEQDPAIWWNALVETVKRALTDSGIKAEDIKGVGFSGQMHGMVPLDKNMKVVRNAILHCDVRSAEQCVTMEKTFPDNELNRLSYNPIFPGMQLVSLIWMKTHEPENFARTVKVVCPKDYIRYMLTDEIGTERTDASGTLAYDVKKQDWAYGVIDRLGLDRALFPDCRFAPYDVAGEICSKAAAETGLLKGTPVVYGGGDQSMQSIGNGLYESGNMTATIGTSGQVMRISDNPIYNAALNTHTFCHVLPGISFSMAAVLNAGITLNWFKRNFAPDLSYAQMSAMAQTVRPGSEGLFFFPAMMGERTPYLDASARGIFLGASFMHTKAHFIRAIMEGVSFEMKTGIDILNDLYGEPAYIVVAGGAVKSAAWLQMQADIYAKTLCIKQSEEQACVGAAIMAGIGCAVYMDVADGCKTAVAGAVRYVEPIRENVERYSEYYDRVFKHIYDNNADAFRSLTGLRFGKG